MNSNNNLLGLVGLAGGVVGGIISYTLNASIGWALFHGGLGWVYVIYRLYLGFSF